ncbi:MAG: endonuclease III [Nitrospirales bacterium]|nr:endonuclease III [Nitrospira sp.]MDR4501004.1 endonuclease III [Nitrospirales bacterium]
MKAKVSPIQEETRQDTIRRVRNILNTLEKTYPRTTLALDFSTPLELLIALILAAQCHDVLVNQVTVPLFKKYRTPLDWANLDPSILEQEIRKVTFYRNKTKSIQKCCQDLVDRFGGTVPETLEDLMSLPGVGRKTANVLRGNAMGQPAIGVDRHVGRISQVLGLTKEKDPDKIEADLNPIVSDKHKVQFCHLLQIHGRTICLARKPKCVECPVNRYCPYPSTYGES